MKKLNFKWLVVLCMAMGFASVAKAQIYVYMDSGKKEHYVHFLGTGMRDSGSSWVPILPGEDAYWFQLVSDNPSYKLYSYNNKEYQRVNYKKFSNDFKTMESYSILYDGTTIHKGTATLIRIENKQVGNNTNTTWGGFNNGNNSSNNGGNSGNEGKGTTTTTQTHGRTAHQVTKSCPLCHGSGKCNSCNGTHRINYQFGSGTLECPNCRPNGACSKCGGSGKITTTEWY